MTKKTLLVLLVLGCVVLSGCTMKVKDGELYINTGIAKNTEIYHSVENTMLDREIFDASINIGEVDLTVSNNSLYNITTIVRYEEGKEPEPPRIMDLKNTVQFNVSVGDITGTIADTFDTLEIDMNVGEVDLSLQSANFKRIDVSVGVGDVTVHLPEKGSGTARIEVGTGTAEVVTSKNAGYLIHCNTTIGAISVDTESIEIERGTYRVNPGKEIAYEIWVWVDVGTGSIEVRG